LTVFRSIFYLWIGVCASSNMWADSYTPLFWYAGTLNLPEISGAVMVDQNLFFVADDVEDPKDRFKKYYMVVLLKDGLNELKKSHQIEISPEAHVYSAMLNYLSPSKRDEDTITDLEDVAISPSKNVYLITSHSLSKKGNAPAKRKQLVRLRFDESTGELEKVERMPHNLLNYLPEALRTALKRRPGEKDNLGNFIPGFNIEGLAWAPEGDLLIGLRSPTHNEDAWVLRLKNADRIFNSSQTLEITVEAQLHLDGHGIRGMCYDGDRKGYWIIAGLSPDLDKANLENDWAIYFWDGKKELLKKWDKKELPDGVVMENPEAICLVKKTETQHLLLISDNGARQASSYVLIPLE